MRSAQHFTISAATSPFSRLGSRGWQPLTGVLSLTLLLACAHSARPYSSPDDQVDLEFDYEIPQGTYSFSVPTDNDDEGWYDSAPQSRSPRRGNADHSHPQRPSSSEVDNEGWAVSGRGTPRRGESRSPEPGSSASGSGTGQSPEAAPSWAQEAPDNDIPEGMVVVYDLSADDDGWADSASQRRRAPAAGSASEFDSEASPQRQPGAAQIVSRRSERQGPGAQGQEEWTQSSPGSRETGESRQRAEGAEADDAEDYSDPFARLQRDLQEAGVEEQDVESRRHDSSSQDDRSLWSRSRQERLPSQPEGRMAAGREAGKRGVHILAGAGLYLPRKSEGAYGAELAYGLNAGWNPASLRSLLLDLNLWRSTYSDGTELVSTSTDLYHMSLRALWQPALPHNFLLATGGGLLLSQSVVGYKVGDAESQYALSFRPGLEAVVATGMRYKLMEFRLEMRFLLRGGMRLDYLPTANVGVAF